MIYNLQDSVLTGTGLSTAVLTIFRSSCDNGMTLGCFFCKDSQRFIPWDANTEKALLPHRPPMASNRIHNGKFQVTTRFQLGLGTRDL
jgi:hypothetical protein